MYYATRRSNNNTRLIGLAAVVVVNALVFWAFASGFGQQMIHEFTNTEVVIIEQPEIEEEEPPPPPPPDVDLPPPPPQVILPDFVFEAPPSETAIQQVQITKDPPRPAEVRPPPPPRPTIAERPKPGRRFQKPEYPSASIRAQEQGEVQVSMCVDEQGRISDVKILKSSGFPRLDDATLKGLPRTRMEPAKGSDGKPIAMCNPPYTFTLVWNLEEAR